MGFDHFAAYFSLHFLPSCCPFLLPLLWLGSQRRKRKRERTKEKIRKRKREEGKRAKHNGKTRFVNVIFGWGGGVLGQTTTITPTTTTTTTKTTMTIKHQRQQQQQEKQPQHHQQQHTENNNHKNKNKTSKDHKKKQTNNWARQNRDPEKNKKWTKLPPNCSGLKIGPKIAHTPQTLLDYKNRHSRR